MSVKSWVIMMTRHGVWMTVFENRAGWETIQIHHVYPNASAICRLRDWVFWRGGDCNEYAPVEHSTEHFGRSSIMAAWLCDWVNVAWLCDWGIFCHCTFRLSCDCSLTQQTPALEIPSHEDPGWVCFLSSDFSQISLISRLHLSCLSCLLLVFSSALRGRPIEDQ